MTSSSVVMELSPLPALKQRPALPDVTRSNSGLQRERRGRQREEFRRVWATCLVRPNIASRKP